MEPLKHILFIDIETVPCADQFAALTPAMQQHWERKSKYLKNSENQPATTGELFEERAGIFSEFAKVVCIGLGRLVEKEGAWNLVLKSIAHDDEKKLLEEFCEVLGRFLKQFPKMQFCGHNIKEFDIPFLCRRMVIQSMQLPECLKLHGKKPWEVPHLDTLELWRFGDYKNYTSLSLLAEVLGIPSPKEDIDGSMVAGVYWKQNDLKRISAYCLRDVYTTARVYLRLKGMTELNIQPQDAEE